MAEERHVVGDAKATLDSWPFWSKVIRGLGFVPALVLQNGMLAKEIPWTDIGAVFVGGTDDWKFSPQSAELVAYARSRGLDAHCGRVNSAKRITDAHEMGCLTFDGGQYSQWADRRIPEGVTDAAHAVAQQALAL